MTELFHQLLEWVSLNPFWAGLVIFTIALSESLAIIGLIVPGVVIMFGIGTLIATGAIPFWSAVAWAVAGAVVGDGLSFWLGHHFKDRLRQAWPFNRHPESLDRGVAFFRRYGGKSVAFGRFFGPVRAVIPMVAGMMQMPTHRFLVANILSALAWAPAYLLPGMVFGASLELASEVAARLVVLLVIIAALVWFSIWSIRLLFRVIQPHSSAIIQKLLDWSRSNPRMGTVAAALADPTHPEARGLSILATLLIITTALFAALMGAVLQGGLLAGADLLLVQLLQGLRTPIMDHLMVIATGMADPLVIYSLMLVVLIFLLWQQHYRSGLYWLAAIAFALVVPFLLKQGLQIPRPSTSPYPETSYAFPSAHTLRAMVIYGFLSVIIAWSISLKWRWLPYTLAGLVIVMVGLSRLYLGAHWLSDVLGSLTLGLAWVASLGLAYRRHSIPESNWRPVSALTITTLVALVTLDTSLNHTQQLAFYSVEAKSRSVEMAQWWNSPDSGVLPSSRGDLRRQQNHPLNLQYSGSLQILQQTLETRGWQTVGPLEPEQLLRLLATGQPVETLPVLPQVHNGEYEALIMVKPVTPDLRRVLRLWPSYIELIPGELPLWIGNASEQNKAVLLGMIAYARTASGFEAALEDLAQGIGGIPTLETRISPQLLKLRRAMSLKPGVSDNAAQPADHSRQDSAVSPQPRAVEVPADAH